VDGWIDASWIVLTPQDLEEIATAIRDTGAGSGPVPPTRPLVAARTSA
jgi:hypothetical protein